MEDGAEGRVWSFNVLEQTKPTTNATQTSKYTNYFPWMAVEDMGQ